MTRRPLLGDLLQEVVKRRGDAKTFVEQFPVASSASNGVIERGNLSVEGQVRVLKAAFEARDRREGAQLTMRLWLGSWSSPRC